MTNRLRSQLDENSVAGQSKMNSGPSSESNRGRWRNGTSRPPDAVMASISVSGMSLAVLPVQSYQLVSDDLTTDIRPF
jgi:hypothetical protein